MRATEEREDTETVSREIKHSEHKSVPATQAALEETLCPRVRSWQCGTGCSEYLGRKWRHHVGDGLEHT